MFEGLIDGYFLPRMVSALAMAAHFDQAGPVADDKLINEIGMTGGKSVPLPALPNRNGRSGYVVQFKADGFNGHYVAFELPQAKYTYKCWFKSLLEGPAKVPVPVDNGMGACPQ
jgi:hypothetical protein